MASATRHWYAALCVGFALASCAAPEHSPGGVFQGTVTLAGRAFPLPPGEWRELGSRQQSNLNPQGSSGVRSIVLVQEQNGRLQALIEISATVPSVEPLYYLDAPTQFACQTAPGNLAPTVRNVGQESVFDCRRLFVSDLRNLGVNPAQAQYEAFAARRAREPDWVAPAFIAAQFIAGDRRGNMAVSYNFSPGTTTTREEAGPRLLRWADAVSPLIAKGFSQGSTSPAPPF